MPKYSYKARNQPGEEESGSLEAQDEATLSRTLRQRGFFVTSIEEAERGGPFLKKLFKALGLKFIKTLGSVSLSEKLFFTRNLGIMLKTGVPLSRAFDILAKQARSGTFRMALQEAADRITKGENLSTALSHFPNIFSPMYQETMKVGEEIGKLEESLRMLSVQMEREYTLKSKVKTAMVYPILVFGLTAGIGVFMMIFAVPKIKAAFVELNVQLPFTTRVILGIADFIVQQWPIAIVVALALSLVAFFVLTTKSLKRARSWVLLRVPLIAKLTRMLNTALVLRTVSSLLGAGVPVMRSLDVASGTLNNYYFQDSLREASKAVEKGKKMAEALAPYEKLYFPMVVQMIEVGEETGETSEILKKLAEFYEEEVAAAMDKLSSTLEPLLIIFIGSIVGFFAVSMMQPMFSVMSGIK